MKSLLSISKHRLLGAATACLVALFTSHAQAQSTAEAADRAYEMASKYSAMNYYMTPSKEGRAGFGVTLEFEIPVSRGLDYVFIVAGDKYCQDVDVWVETEDTGNTIVKDTRKVSNGLAGVRWRSDYSGSVNVVVHFARVSSRCGWCALVGRRGTASANLDPSSQITTAPGSTQKIEGAPKGGGEAIPRNP